MPTTIPSLVNLNFLYYIRNVQIIHKYYNFDTFHFFLDIDIERLRHAPALEFIDLQANPLTARMHDLLNTLTRIKIELTPRQVEEWEDLTI